MKIRDLDLDQYVIVYDIGKSENNNGMTVVGRAEELLFYNEGFHGGADNMATINSLGNLYDITDDNEFELWTKSIEDKTESINTTVKWNDNGNLEVKDNYEIKVPNDILDNNSDVVGYIKDEINTHRSNDLQQRKRRNIKLIDSETVEFENGRQMKVIVNNGKTKPTSVYWVDDKTIGFDNGSRVTIPENYETEDSHNTVNHPSHYNYGDIEVIDYCDQVCKTYPPELAPYVFNAIKYLSRANHKNGREDIDKAKFYIQRLFDKWDVK